MATLFYDGINQIAIWSRELSAAHFPSQDQCDTFTGDIWEACKQSNQLHELWWDHSLGFSRNSWAIFNKKRLFDFTGRHTLQNYSSTFMCHVDFIPDRSCLDVPVGRKCSACNGLAPEFLYELQYISEAFPPSLPLNWSKNPRPWRRRPCGQQMCENTNTIHCFWWFAHIILQNT